MKKLKFLVILVALFLISGCSKSYLKEISYDEYKKLLEDDETFILEVMSNDCTACKDFRPKLEEVASDYKIEVKYINIDKLTADQYDELAVSATPTVIFYIDGEEETTAARIVGSVKKEKIISKFKASGFIEGEESEKSSEEEEEKDNSAEQEDQQQEENTSEEKK